MTAPVALWANNAGSTLASAITNTQTTVTLASGTGVLFPSPAAGQFFAITFVSQANVNTFEIAYCTARSTDTLTVTRGQESTTALAFSSGDFARNYVTAGALETLANLNGSSSQVFNVANAAISTEAVPLGQAEAIFAALNGNASEAFSAAPAASTNEVVTLFQFSNFLGATGTQRLPNGLILQWGSGVFPNSGGRTSSQSVTFNVAFGTAPLFAAAIPTNGLNSSLGGIPSSGITAISTSGATFIADSLGYANFNQAVTFLYFAIGF